MITRKKIRRRLAPAFILAGGSAGASLLHSAMPIGTGAGLASASTGFAAFSGVTATIGGAGLAMDVLGDIKPKRRRRR